MYPNGTRPIRSPPMAMMLKSLNDAGQLPEPEIIKPVRLSSFLMDLAEAWFKYVGIEYCNETFRDWLGRFRKSKTL